MVWTADFTGHLRTGDGVYCYPLTVVDGASRYLLTCHGLPSVETTGARIVFERLFRARGLQARLCSGNGAPFSTNALERFSALSVWRIKLGITPEVIGPSSPQQNGRHKRMHRAAQRA